MKDEELSHKMIQALALREQVKVLNETLEQFKGEIKIELNNRELDRYTDKLGNQATYRENVRKTLDRKMVEQKLAPELFKECFKESRFDSLTILSKEEVEKRKTFMEKNDD